MVHPLNQNPRVTYVFILLAVFPKKTYHFNNTVHIMSAKDLSAYTRKPTLVAPTFTKQSHVFQSCHSEAA
jgi:hypothetical protein